MKDKNDADAGPMGRPESPATDEYAAAPRNGRSTGLDRRPANGHPPGGNLNIWLALDVLANRWHWLVIGFMLGGTALGYLAWTYIQPRFTATAQLLRIEPPDFFKAGVTPETFSGLIRSRELLDRVGKQAKPPIAPEQLTKQIKVDPEPESQIVKVMLSAGQPQQAVDLLNSYLREAVSFTKQMQTNQATKIANEYLAQQVTKMNEDIANLTNRFLHMQTAAQFAPLTNKVQEISGELTALGTNLAAPHPSAFAIQRQREGLERALDELFRLRSQYTDLNPLVQAKTNEVDELQRELAKMTTNSASVQASAGIAGAPRPAGPTFDPQVDLIRMSLLSLEEGHVQLVQRQREAQYYAENPPGLASIFDPAVMKTVQNNLRWLKVSVVSVFGGMVGMALSLCLVMLVEVTDRRMRTIDDLERITKLPVLTTLGDLREMNPAEQADWAFRTWTMLQGQLSPSANHGLVCGITSAAPGEGRSTWISLLAEAASLTGFRVLTIATRPSPSHHESPHQVGDASEASEASEASDTNEANGTDPEGAIQHSPEANGENHNGHERALAGNVLKTPSKVTEQLTGPNSQPMVHIPLPGWVWNLERRKQWREALNQWRKIDNLVILVELPPANVPEAVLLGCNLPNLLWLTSSGAADAGKARTQLETLRHARCNLVGAVLNRQTAVPIRNRFPRWVGGVAAMLVFGVFHGFSQDGQSPANASAVQPVQPALAQPAVDASAPLPGPAAGSSTALAFSVNSPAQRAEWQKHLTLGPGDLLNFGLYGQPELARAEISVGPDGRVSYLEAQDVLATGLTLDELRAAMDSELAKYRRSPRALITPVAFRSKRYYMLGKVNTKGVYVLDRPITVLEAIARAHGLESGLVDRNVVNLADFQRSFLARGGKRYPLNFEQLFQQGDLSQNIPVEPGDYIYFAGSDIKEVYVVGEIRLPGPVTYTPATTIMAAISARGGYTDRAYKTRVLVVRGSLNNPETYAVNTHAILDAKAPDFQLQPRDIIYVNSRPFIRVEELADLAATAFIQSLITTFVGVDVVKPIY